MPGAKTRALGLAAAGPRSVAAGAGGFRRVTAYATAPTPCPSHPRPRTADRGSAPRDRLPAGSHARGDAGGRVATGSRSSWAHTSTAKGGVCPMLAAHRRGGRTDLLAFAHAWDRFTGAGRRPRRASRRELGVLVAHLEASLLEDAAPELAPRDRPSTARCSSAAAGESDPRGRERDSLASRSPASGSRASARHGTRRARADARIATALRRVA